MYLVVSHVDSEGWIWRRHSRESGNPGRVRRGFCWQILDARLRGHDKNEPSNSV